MKLFIFTLLIFIDFLSKKIIYNLIDLNNFVSVTPFLDIIHIHNYGISFGLLAGVLPVWFIVILGIIIVFFLVYWMLKSANKYEKWGILLIIAGAISNIGDRLFNNYVLDFIYINFDKYYWPAFNFADIYISIGVLIILIESYKMFKINIKKNE
tara:strand:- start:59 stop:520 length:462 start_codon:yes stop_codon:yes gene_type:complete